MAAGELKVAWGRRSHGVGEATVAQSDDLAKILLFKVRQKLKHNLHCLYALTRASSAQELIGEVGTK